METIQTLARFLKRVAIFEGLSLDLLTQICQHADLCTFEDGEQIIQKGASGECMYVLLEGSVKIPVTNDADELLYVSELEPGQIFGEMALLTGNPRSSDVFAASRCRCLALSKSIVEHLMRTDPDIAWMLTAILNERVKRAGTAQKVGKYTILGELARGSMAVVYDGLHPDLGRPLAIKMLHHELVYRPQFAERFRNEARIIAHLRHPHIVEVFDLEEAYATFFIIMEKIHGFELQHAIQTRGKMSYFDARRCLRQLLSALQFAHECGVIHRDLKPSNVMLDQVGNAKLMDFGIALLPQQSNGPDETEMLLGTPHFMAPEQHRCAPLDHRADLYALGIMAYNMVTGTLPFRGRLSEIAAQKQKCKQLDLRSVAPNAPDDLHQLIQMCTQRDPQDRPKDCQTLLDLLEPVEPSNGYQLSQLSTETLTFVYPPQQENVVRALLEKYAARAENLHEVQALRSPTPK